jgi:hypothetical protein
VAEDFLEAEAKAQTQLERELRRHVDTAISALNLIADVANTAPPPVPSERPRAMHVGLFLLLRITNDLRCSFLLAEMGYPLQAASLVASMHEATYTIPYIGNDKKRAQEWLNHQHPTKPFRSVATLTKEGVANFGAPSSEVNRAYKKYSQLCWAKHIAPFAEWEISLSAKDGQDLVMPGPNTTSAGIRAAWFTLEQAVWYTYIAIRSFIHFHLGDRIGNTLDTRIQQLVNEYNALRAAFVRRWGMKTRSAVSGQTSARHRSMEGINWSNCWSG